MDPGDCSFISSVSEPTKQSIENGVQPNQNPLAVVDTNYVRIVTPSYGPNPVELDCPYCKKHVISSVNRVGGSLPWILMISLFLLGFLILIPWCLCFIPFCLDSCLDAIHTCPSCKRFLGRHNKI